MAPLARRKHAPAREDCVQNCVQTSLGQGQKLVTAWGLGCLRHCQIGRYAMDGHSQEHVTRLPVRLCVYAHILMLSKNLYLSQ